MITGNGVGSYCWDPVSISGHEYARDRMPWVDPLLPLSTSWRRRWTCSCGQVGDWRLRSDNETYQDWASHAKQAGRQRVGGARGGGMVDAPTVLRSTTHRTAR